jgi:hypothetical protein
VIVNINRKEINEPFHDNHYTDQRYCRASERVR